MFSAFLLLLVLSSPSAISGLGLLACSGSVFISYDPPVTDEIQVVTATQWINFTTCLDISGNQITAGWTERVIDVNTSCQLLNVSTLELPPVTFNFTWVPCTLYSTIYFPTGSAVLIGGSSQAIRTGGNVTSGALMGGNATLSLTIPVLNITACAQGDVANISGTATLGIIDFSI